MKDLDHKVSKRIVDNIGKRADLVKPRKNSTEQLRQGY
jgi:hypothetical protein